ncbi:MAG: T9SS type A sorting domain-containing protein, partial [Flavobacteriales bacterium]|nr:T9SS type A sorting domain-containing protein [Flavobacteriales bacterium]
ASMYQDWDDVTKSGVFYNEYDDKLIIEWREFFNATGGAAFDRQLILYKDGRFKMQYYSSMNHIELRAVDGLIGIENEDASEFVQVSYFQKFAGKDVAVEFSPAIKKTLKGGESKNLEIVFDATNRFASESVEYLSITTNDPLNSNIEIPAHVIINGDPVAELTNDLAFGEVMVSPITKFYSKEFNITNTGSARMIVGRLELEHNVDAVLQAQVYDRAGKILWVDLPSTYVPRDFDIEPFKSVGPFRILLSPENSNFLNRPYTNKLKMRTDFGARKTEFNITADYSLPPLVTVDKTEISHVSFDNSLIYDNVKLGNINGDSELKYSISLDYNRETIAPSFIETAFVSGELNVIKKTISASANIQSVKEETYNRILAYDLESAPNNAIGLGGDSELTVATSFTAPEDGFKLSNVQTWFIPESLRSTDIKIEIRVGNNIDDSTVQLSQEFNYTTVEDDDSGVLLDIQLEEPVLLMPYEKFHIVFTYPGGLKTPQGAVTVVDKPNTFFIHYINDWFDLQELQGFGAVGFMVRAAEKEAENLNWLEISDIEGVVEKGTEKSINITLYPERSRRANNDVVMTFSTNDPINETLDLSVHLRINQGPEIEARDDYSVFENDTLNISFEVIDVEGNGIKKVTMQEYANTSFNYSNGKVNFKYMPTYSDAGTHTFEVSTEDDLGVESINSFNVEVVNVNVAPLVINTDNIIIDKEAPQYKSNFNNIFSDPDNGEMIFTAEIIGNKEVAKVFMSGDEFIVSPLKTGFSKVELTALDSDGDKTTTVKVIVVNALLSVEELLAKKWSVYPNPVNEELRISVNGLKDKSLSVRILDQSGAVVQTFEAEVENNAIIESVSGLSSGVYLIELKGKEGRSVNKMIKN